MPEYYSDIYKVDIEYNRYYKNQKYVSMEDKPRVVRPDIIVHTRMKSLEQQPQHLLVIEAKKDVDSENDTKKIISFILDKKYKYLFGLKVRYNDFDPICATLFYRDAEDDEIIEEHLEYFRT